ncbi:MAG: lysophospholipid acyltransferase family protein [Alphaproteobacteria bacterium]|nr:lysophospholipid acyltransferase family protein [Alphaproteobacteria bacterium]
MSDPTVLHSRLTAISRATVYVVFTLALIPVQAVALLLRLPLSRRIPLWYHQVCCRLLGVRLEVFGRRSKARPTLFVGNHASYLDVAIYGALIPGSFVAKSEVVDWLFFGTLAKLQRSVFVDRRVRTSQLQATALGKRLSAGDSMILFPEGTSNDGTHIQRFKSALLSVAEFQIDDAPLVVQPVSLTYSRVDGVPIGRHLRPFYAWYGDMDLVSHAAVLIGLGRLTVTVSFHEPVTVDQFASRKQLTEYCQEQIEAGHSDALAGRIQPKAGAAGRWDWIRWRLRPRLSDMKGLRRSKKGFESPREKRATGRVDSRGVKA